MPDSPLTQRDVENLRTTVDKLDKTLEQLPDRIDAIYVRKDVYERDQAAMLRDLEQHSRWLEWAQRIVVGAVLVALLSLVLVQALGTNAP